MDGTQQLSAFRGRSRVVIHVDAVGTVDVGVAVAEHPEADKVVLSVQFQLGRDQLSRAAFRVGVGIETRHILASVMWHSTRGVA